MAMSTQEKLKKAAAGALVGSLGNAAFAGAKHYLTMREELAKQRDQIEQLAKLAERDPLTGLKNRRAFNSKLSEQASLALRHGDGSSGCLVIMDIDHFKRINDAHGHPAGDVVLEKLGRLLEQHVRPYDTSYRVGGEEMAVILPDSTIKGTVAFAERFREHLAATNFGIGEAVTASFGVSTIINDPDETYRMADEALYVAKNEGRDMVVAAPPRLTT